MTAVVRRREIDALRGIAVLGMVVYHGAYDLATLHLADIDVFSGGWRLLARTVLATFLLVSGLSDGLTQQRTAHRPDRWRRMVRRAAILGLSALLVTIATRIAAGDDYVRFGVLHCLAAAALLLPLVDPLADWAIGALGLAVILGGTLLHGDGSLLTLPFGLPPAIGMVDYVPLLPWFGVILLGRSLASLVARCPTWNPPIGMRWLPWIGRNALPIYLGHQPVMLVVIWLLLTS